MGWDRGDYDVRARKRVLELLRDRFFYAGRGFRGGRDIRPRPPVSWTKSIPALVEYWYEVGIPNRKIDAWEAEIEAGIDVPAIANWYLMQGGKDRLRAERLIGFEEVLTLSSLSSSSDVTYVEQIGTLVERGLGHGRSVKLIGR